MASAIVETPSSRIAFTSRSCSVPFARSTRPFACGELAQIPNASVAGKTGTAEFYDPKSDKWTQHAWFTGFAPYDKPEVVVTVYFDIGTGGTHAAPVAAKILQYYFENVAR